MNLSIFKRRLSTSIRLHKLVLPPVQVSGVVGRYAIALYSAATKSKNLDAVEKDMNTIRSQLAKDTHLREFCKNPSLKRSIKVTEFAKVLDKLKVNPPTKNMFAVFAENGRLAEIDSLLVKFGQVMSAHRGEVLCTVWTAKPLDKSTEQELRAVLKEFLKPNEKLTLTLETNPSLIGGMVVRIGDQYVDMSIAHKIHMYSNLLRQPL